MYNPKMWSFGPRDPEFEYLIGRPAYKYPKPSPSIESGHSFTDLQAARAREKYETHKE